MNLYAAHYVYDDRQEERETFRAAHLDYLDSLVAAGRLLAYGKYADELDPGALFIYLADDADAVETMIAGDPYVAQGFVPGHDVRLWPARGTWPATLRQDA